MSRVGMGSLQQVVLLLCCMLACWCATNFEGSHAEVLRTTTFRSPPFSLGPGEVIDKYLPVNMPKGHIAVRNVAMDLVSSDGTRIPLSETYLHHWVLIRYYIDPTSTTTVNVLTQAVPNDGVCNPFLVQYFGFGSEFRRSNVTVPAPYGIVLGNPTEVPEGQVEAWFLNLHAIDTRGVQSVRDCNECLCTFYNSTGIDGYGRPIPQGYKGGVFCCHDQTHCPLRLGFTDVRRELFLEFVVTYVDYSDAVVPLKVYILDVTDKRTSWDQSAQCQVEYTVPKCEKGAAECVHSQEAVAFLPKGGYVVASSAHLHSGGIVASVALQNGREICVSHPIYGKGTEAGNETGYVVGMTSCYPDPKSIYIRAKEKLHMKAVYENSEEHTGVMGIFLLLIAEGPPELQERSPTKVFVTLAVMAMAVAVGLALYRYRNKRRRGVNYKPIV